MTDRICAVPDCGRLVEARGWCAAHYYRWQRYDDPLGRAEPRKPKPRLPCTVDGCDSPRYGRGWCANHYARWRRHGGLHDKRAERRDVRLRFERWINRNGSTPEHRPDLGKCWNWTGNVNGSGYGSFKVDDDHGTLGAHVVALLLTGREVPPGKEVDHLCRNTRCVRPDHLDVVTHTENVRRSLPFRQIRTECVHGHALTPDNIMRSQGPNACRTCFKASQRRYRQKQKALRRAS